MSTLDLILIGIVLAFTLVSAAWGVVRQAIAVVGLIIGIMLAGAYSEQIGSWFGFIGDKPTATGVAYILIIVVISSAFSIVASVLYFVVGLLFLGLLDHALGAVLGFVQGVLAVGVILVGGSLIFPTWMNEQISKSALADKIIDPLTNLALLVAPQNIKEIIQAVKR
jgi:membrane protein required for colicin V production